MKACIEVAAAGLGNTLQDQGRWGHRRAGVPWSGFLDVPLAHAANTLVGNAGNEVCIEVRAVGPKLRVLQGPVWFALAGNIEAMLVRASGLQEQVPAWQSVIASQGDCLLVGVAQDACAYVAIGGGVDVPADMGSCSTYASIGLGGINGRALSMGDQLYTHTLDERVARNLKASHLWQPWPADVCGAATVRVMLGPQDDCFTEQALHDLFHTTWHTSAAQDRMGVRLVGHTLQHRGAADVVSDGIAPGAIQVPASGEPIVLLADCQTMGGYAKVATVISADLAKMAHMPAGTALRFEPVCAEQAHAALRAGSQQWQHWCGGVVPYVPPGWLDEAALASANLISGVVRAHDTHFDEE